MTNSEIINGYQKIINDQAAIIKNCFGIIEGYKQQLGNMPSPTTQGLLDTEILLEHVKKNTTAPFEFDSLKLSDEERRSRFGTRIRFLRKSLEMTQDNLAEKIGVSKSAIALIETGRREASFKNLIALARALGTTTDWLLGNPPL